MSQLGTQPRTKSAEDATLPITCEQCQRTYKRPTEYTRHLLDKVACPTCPRQFRIDKGKQFLSHVDKAHPDMNLQDCSNYFEVEKEKAKARPGTCRERPRYATMTGARPTGEASVHHPPESTELASVDPIYQYHPRPLYQDHGNQGLPYAAEDPFDPSFMLTATWPAVDETNLDQHINSWDALFGDDTFCTFF